MKKLLLILLCFPFLFISCKNTSINNIDIDSIEDPCELVEIGIIICEEAKDLRKKIESSKNNDDFDDEIDKVETAWFDMLDYANEKRWNKKLQYCDNYNKMMRVKLSGGNPDF